MEIGIDRIEVSGNELRCKPRLPRSLGKYLLTDTLTIRYDSSVDLEKCGESILAIPVVSLLAPIAWAAGADIRINELDATYLESMVKIKDIFKDIFPRFSCAGGIHAEKAVVNDFGGSGILLPFSGGVDSLASYLKYRDRKPDLVLVSGVQVPLFERDYWCGMRADVDRIAGMDGVKAFHIEGDLFRDLNFELLSRDFLVEWVEDVAGSLCLLGLCAPITSSGEIGTVLIASSHTAAYTKPSAARPVVDNEIAWAGVRVIHDSYEMRRQEKLRYICQHEGKMAYLSNLRACQESVVRENCGRCEKCFRTIVGLTVEGVNPGDCNFKVAEGTYRHIKDCFLKGKIAMGDSRRFEWEGIQKMLPAQMDTGMVGAREFLEWLREFDFSKYRANRLRSFIWDTRRLYGNKRIKLPSIRRKAKSYYYMVFSRLGLA